MSGTWFSNRGQVIAVICAVAGVLIGAVSQWDRISPLLTMLLFPAAAITCFHLGRYVQRFAQAAEQPAAVKPQFLCEYLNPTIKVGSFYTFGGGSMVKRVSVLSMKEEDILSSQPTGVEVEVSGTALYPSHGDRVKKINDRRFFLLSDARTVKSESSCIFEFAFDEHFFRMTAITVDHINVPAQEVTLSVCNAAYEKS